MLEMISAYSLCVVIGAVIAIASIGAKKLLDLDKEDYKNE